jgi:mono/diheme cytochrome c family protein
MKSKSILTAAIIAVSMVGFAFTTAQQTKPWPVPDKNAKMVNPVKADKESLANGKSLWSMNCSSCHGKTGLGDGSKSAQLKTQPQDMTKGDAQSQSDGSLFYKISEGRGDMPSFKKKIADPDDIWSLVSYIRTLKK